jgi:tetratricopeptide (TPR) repeat protein
MIYHVLNNLGEVARHQGNYERAVPLYEESLTLIREVGDEWLILYPLVNLAAVRRHLGDYEQAAAYLKECLLRSRDLDFKEAIAECLGGYAGLAAAQAQPERAARLWAAAEVLREAIGVPLQVGDRNEYDGTVASAYDVLGEAAFAAAWAAGRAMTLEQTMTYALEEPDQ